MLRRYRIKTCEILNLVPRFSWLSDSFDGAKEGVIGAIKTKGFFFPHSLIELFRNRKTRAWKIKQQCYTCRNLIVEKKIRLL